MSNHADEPAGAKPTIVGGRPPERGGRDGSIPRGLEVLLKKAAVDPAFRRRLLRKRARAAGEIDIELTAGERSMLETIPKAQLKGIIKHTKVPDAQRQVFLGAVGAEMLAALTPEPSAGDDEGIGQIRMKPRGLLSRGARPPMSPLGKAVQEQIAEQLVVTKIRTGPASDGRAQLTVRVGYDCPFKTGRITIYLCESKGVRGAAITYRPTQSVVVSEGRGDVTFRASGTGGATNWLVVRLHSTARDCQEATTSWPRGAYAPGEYLVGGCAIWRMVEYRHVWPAKE